MVERALNLWLFAPPVLLVTWGVMRMVRSARLRYGIAVLAFFFSLAPWMLGRPQTVEIPRAAIFSLLPPVWVAGALLLLIREGTGHVLLRRLRGTRAEHDLDGVPLFLSPHGPYTAGLLRPYIVLPPGDVDERVARHELAHARWRDPLVHAVLRLIAAIFWIAPVWPFLRWAQREREAAADEAAMRANDACRHQYVDLLRRMACRSRVLPAHMAAGDLEYRARCLLDLPRRRSLAAVLALFAGLALLTLTPPVELPSKRIVEVHK
jgi:hypothetical protein